jgi:PAS domain S-box-containing protein
MRPALDEVRKSTQQGAQVFLVGEDGEFLVHPEREREFGKQLGNPWLLTDEFPYVRDQQGRIDQSARIITDNDGMQFAMMVHPATLAGGPRLYAIKTVPYADIAAPAIEVRNTSMMAGMIVAVAAILIAVITTRTMSKPLEQVTAAIASYAGNGRPALPVDTPGEVGVLAKAFERMMDNVRRNQLAMESEITERRRLEEQFRLAVESSPSGILLVEPDGTIKMANAESERMFGYARGELPGRSVDVLVPESIRARHAGLRQGYATAPTARRMGMGIDLNGIRKDGSSLAVEIGLTPLQTSDGLLVLSTIVDVTARKLAQERLSAYAKRLRSSNEDLEQFAYVTSHDLRAPLRGIASVAEWLAEDLGEELDERSKDNIRLMLMRTDRLSRLIDGILQYSRAGRGRQEIDPVDVEPLVRDVIFTLAAPDWVRIRLQGDFPIVQYDTTQLRQVFQNLISNAIVHMNRPEGEIVVSCTADADAWRFSVRDNGVGIPEQHLERIFELFQTLRPKDEGNTTGVGLSIVKRIVERNGGVVRVASSVGQGADFVFTVPFVPVATLSVISEVSI